MDTMTLGMPFSPTMAHNLFIAVATDTGWFRHSNTSPATFALAGDLMAAGARPTEAYELIYETSNLPRLRLLGRMLDRLAETSDGQIAYSEVYLADYDSTGAIPPDTEDLINYPRSLAGVELALLFIEQRAVTFDEPRLLQRPHPAEAWRRRNADPARQLDVGDATVVLQLFENLSVDDVETRGHNGLRWQAQALPLSPPLRNIIAQRRYHDAPACGFRSRRCGSRPA